MIDTTVDGAAHLAVAQLEDDIVRFLHEEELRKMPCAKTIASQPEVGWDMRSRLIEFLMQAQHILGLSEETLMLGISITDRYSAKRVIFARHHQLVGCVSLWLAAKILDEKNKVPTVSDLTYICAGTYMEGTIRDMELHVLASLDWELSSPTTYDFIDWNICCVYRRLVDQDETFYTANDYAVCGCMARYICACAVFKHEIVFSYTPSAIASSAVALSLVIIDALGEHNRPFLQPVDFSKECFDDLASAMSDPPVETMQRYSSGDNLNVAVRVYEFFQERIAGKASVLSESVGPVEPTYPPFSQGLTPPASILPVPAFTAPELVGSCESPLESPSTMQYMPPTPEEDLARNGSGIGHKAQVVRLTQPIYYHE